ncbi:129aa long hypothetical protein [Pyrococcus horikoshii OT3]|uniref:Uncharacterized protein n=1 Tax=Pyrococcus horikoshii (strain ATCC 700860 / DSM 12428 / JCM 9974 / NBRC 100139 / OT-3) TaxID=70601 RepID=O58756_PYRHO|nr:129aa long hypothetical protein [Pyrococcus horikoshii OT3]
METWTIPGNLPISTAPVMVTLFLTSSTLIPKSFAALLNPLSAASLIVGPEPIIWSGATGSTSIPNFFANLSTFSHSSFLQGLARGGRSSSGGKRIGPSRFKPFITSTVTVVSAVTSVVWPATSPSPSIA